MVTLLLHFRSIVLKQTTITMVDTGMPCHLKSLVDAQDIIVYFPLHLRFRLWVINHHLLVVKSPEEESVQYDLLAMSCMILY
jgi:hypothetical protein